MTTNNTLFATLNALRVDAGMPALTSNKLSRAALESAIAKLSDVATINDAAKRKRAAKLSRDAEHKRDDNATFTLATLARELGISPKIVRAKARRNAGKLAAMMTADKHVYRQRDRAAIVDFIMSGRRAD